MRRKETIPEAVREHAYANGVPFRVSQIALHSFGIKISEQSTERMSALMRLTRVVDDCIDEYPSSLRAGQSIEFLVDALGEGTQGDTPSTPDITEELVSATDTVREKFSKDECLRIASKGLQIIAVSYQAREAVNVAQYARAIRLEGQLCSNLLLLSLTEQERSCTRYRDFHMYITRLGRLGNLLDATIDYIDDSEHALHVLQPTFTNRTALLGQGLTDATLLVRHLKMPLVREFCHSFGRIITTRRKSD